MKIEKRYLLIWAVVFMSAIGRPLWADSIKVSKAEQASAKWLSEVDNGQFSKSWEAASAYLKKAVDENRWEKSLTAVRKPLGKVLARKVLSSTYTKTLPGAPDGEYVVIQYRTSFENKASALETVTPSLEMDGKWRVSGYYIK
jgi:hypothetical protein